MRLPPLNALRAFEAAARHGGFIGASEELHVTRGAISRQVKLLEEHLGVQLFTRQSQGVKLTDAGRRLLPVLTQAFALITNGTEQISAEAADLRIICPPATSIRWLIPRLDEFRKLHPEIRVRLTTDFYGDIGFDAAEFDVGFTVEYWPGRVKVNEMATLFPVYITPACAPDLLKEHGSLNSPEELSNFTLLHETPGHPDWSGWVKHFGVSGIDPATGQDFPNLDMATKAAVMGAGMVMADLVLCREELENGTLIAPLRDMICVSPFGGVTIQATKEKWSEPKVEAFCSWAMNSAVQDIEYLNTLNLP